MYCSTLISTIILPVLIILLFTLIVIIINLVIISGSKYIFVENNKIEILFSKYIFGLYIWTLESKSEYIVRK